MSDEWNDEVEEAPRKKKGGLPAWFWWTCGVGCLLVIVMVAVIAFFAVMVGQKISDPEYAKEKLADVLPSEQWPEGYAANGLDLFGAFGEYAVRWPGGVAVVIVMSGRGDIEDMLDPDSSTNMFNKEFEEGEIEVQGKSAPSLRFRDLGGMHHLRIDISGELAPYAVIELVQDEKQGAPGDELVADFLEPFDIWRGE
ncbi:MAG: hypothetical protein AAF682_19145 [Planctomycetota bacterium]